ncbi:hypothetical protein Tco_1014425, partial [Tanacetum coccineum]
MGTRCGDDVVRWRGMAAAVVLAVMGWPEVGRRHPDILTKGGQSLSEVTHPYDDHEIDEECVVERDFSNCAMGRVKSFDSITKLQSLLVDEGFVNVTLSYLGGLWVMFECDKPDTKRNLVNHVGINSWFQVIQE